MIVCRNDEKRLYGILEKEEGEVKSASEEQRIELNSLFYFLVCAKIPYYMTKVQKNMKHSFVSAALSLYYLERFYLFSSITKLIEVFLFDCSYV